MYQFACTLPVQLPSDRLTGRIGEHDHCEHPMKVRSFSLRSFIKRRSIQLAEGLSAGCPAYCTPSGSHWASKSLSCSTLLACNQHQHKMTPKIINTGITGEFQPMRLTTRACAHGFSLPDASSKAPKYARTAMKASTIIEVEIRRHTFVGGSSPSSLSKPFCAATCHQ